jgi:hypothetical protein
MKYRPIGLPLRSRPRRCSSVGASSSPPSDSGTPWHATRPRRPFFAPPLPTTRRIASRSHRRAPSRGRPSPACAATAALLLAVTTAVVVRRACGRRARRWAGRHRHGVADLRLANERSLGRFGRRPTLAHRLGQFDVVAVVDVAIVDVVIADVAIVAGRTAAPAPCPPPRRRWPPREPRRRLEPDGLPGAPEGVETASDEVSAVLSVERSESA